MKYLFTKLILILFLFSACKNKRESDFVGIQYSSDKQGYVFD
ncbi:hypothetical protein [uncultured Lacinutrix sp.]|nr:hypothetical protein [uncultured Lacinutrix sp.]